MRRLQKRTSVTEVYYPLGLHAQKCFEHLGHQDEDFPQAQQAGRETIALPIYSELTDTQKSHVVESLLSALR